MRFTPQFILEGNKDVQTNLLLCPIIHVDISSFFSASLLAAPLDPNLSHCASNCILVLMCSNKIIREPRSISTAELLRSPKDLFDILLFEYDVNRLDEVPGGTIRAAVDKIIVHPKYDNVTFDFDVALVRLERSIDLTSPSTFHYDAYNFHSNVSCLITVLIVFPHYLQLSVYFTG
jgi:hypothetical protein